MEDSSDTSYLVNTLQLGKSWVPEQAGSGLDRVYHALTQHLPDTDVSVRGLVAGTPDVSVDSNQQVQAFARDTASLPRRLFAVRQATQRMLNVQLPHLVASHFALYTAPALDLCSDLPLVVHFHGPWAGESDVEGESALAVRAKKMVERYVYRHGTRFIVLSEAFRRVLETEYRVPASTIRIVPGGVDTERFDTGVSPSAARERLGWPTARPIILSVRRLAQRMGLEHLVTAMRTVIQHVPDALLLIAGKGPLAAKLEARIAEAELDAHVRLLGFVPDEDLPFAYRAADFTVVPTIALEGFGLITIESLATGTPVLVTPRGGLPEVVRPLSDALIFEDTDPAALADRMTKVLTGRCSLPSAEACAAYARERFAWPVIARKTRSVYEEVLS